MKYDLKWLTTKFDNGETINYIFFGGHSNEHGDEIGKFAFSQWYLSPFVVDNINYKTAAHWMMAHKAGLFGDYETFHRILMAETSSEVKELGRQVRGFDEMKWNEKKFELVRTGNIHKFNQHKKLKDFLIDTGENVIVEASATDTVWGIGLNQEVPMIENPYSWRGENRLGFALMEARDFLRGVGNVIPIELSRQRQLD
jgi:ribA/ribD-fused uncharacterized protein